MLFNIKKTRFEGNITKDFENSQGGYKEKIIMRINCSLKIGQKQLAGQEIRKTVF